MVRTAGSFEIPSQVFADGVRYYWTSRANQSSAAIGGEGEAQSVRGGKQLNGVLDAIVRQVKAHGVLEREIFVNCSLLHTGKLALPGYFRPTKVWDLLVIRNKQLLAAMELKSQAGPSFGNNTNNRAEEAIGSSEDFWIAHREKAFQQVAAPWLGYFFLLEDSSDSSKNARTVAPHFPVFPELRNASYAKRYEELCKRLVLERKYTSTCLLLSKKPRSNQPSSSDPVYTEPSEALNASQFLTSLLRAVMPG